MSDPPASSNNPLWRSLTLVIAPLLTAGLMSAALFDTHIEAIREARGLFIGILLADWVACLLVPRRPALGPIALMATFLSLGITLYVFATVSGAASAVSFVDRPLWFLALLSVSATLTALLPTHARR